MFSSRSDTMRCQNYILLLATPINILWGTEGCGNLVVRIDPLHARNDTGKASGGASRCSCQELFESVVVSPMREVEDAVGGADVDGNHVFDAVGVGRVV